MLEKFSIHGFKSLVKVDGLKLPRLAVLFGPNAAGKSNFLDAVQALSRIGTSRTLSEALQEPIRGYAIEAFSFPAEGLPGLLSRDSADFGLKAVLGVEKDRYAYRVQVKIDPHSGSITVQDEYLAVLGKTGQPKGSPLVERVEQELRIRRRGKAGNPRREPVGLPYSLLSDPRLSGLQYRGIERCRSELARWRTYYLDPRVSMRRAAPPSDVEDVGMAGENIAPFLYRLRAEKPKAYAAMVRTLRTLVPSVENVDVDLDSRRGTLDIVVREAGVNFSSRIVSEGTLRVLALCAIVVNPWGGSLVAFEEPENGVHPRRLELIAELLTSLVVERKRQLIVTSHSTLFCAAMLKKARDSEGDVGLFRTSRGSEGTRIEPFGAAGPLFDDGDIAAGLADRGENGVLEGLILRGMLDE